MSEGYVWEGTGVWGCQYHCVCVCVCDAQIFQIMLKPRGPTMMRLNHKFRCSVALSPSFRNWVEMTRNKREWSSSSFSVPHPVLPCVKAPLGESDVLLTDAGDEEPTGAAVLLADTGVKNPRVLLQHMC